VSLQILRVLISDSAGYINGEMVVQDGGAHLRRVRRQRICCNGSDAQWEQQRTARSKS